MNVSDVKIDWLSFMSGAGIASIIIIGTVLYLLMFLLKEAAKIFWNR